MSHSLSIDVCAECCQGQCGLSVWGLTNHVSWPQLRMGLGAPRNGGYSSTLIQRLPCFGIPRISLEVDNLTDRIEHSQPLLSADRIWFIHQSSLPCPTDTTIPLHLREATFC